MNKKFQTGDVVVDEYNHHGIVIKYNKYRDDTLALLIKTGDYCNTLESLEHNWKYVDHYDEFEQILKSLGE
jgi:hypothetical protein